MKILPHGFKWNQAIIDESHFRDVLVILIGFHSSRQPFVLGTGFIIGAFGNSAVICTAAHLFAEIHESQNPHRKNHPSALSEFLPHGEPLNIDRKVVRAACTNGKKVEVAIIGWAVWDKSSDIALCGIRPQNKEENFFEKQLLITDSIPKIGDIVAVLGYAGLKVQNVFHNGGYGFETFEVTNKVILRAGTVSEIYTEGQRLIKGPCIETTIPVLHGMSGSPVMAITTGGREIRPFGVVSSDISIDSDITCKTMSSSLVALIEPRINLVNNNLRKTVFNLNKAFFAYDP